MIECFLSCYFLAQYSTCINVIIIYTELTTKRNSQQRFITYKVKVRSGQSTHNDSQCLSQVSVV